MANANGTPDPLGGSFSSTQPSVSKAVHLIAGIKCTVHGVKEIPADCQAVSVLWILHPRGSSQDRMEPLAAQAVAEWNKRLSSSPTSGGAAAVNTPQSGPRRLGLVAVAFDQRNHGTRMLDEGRNEAWRGGNATHAQDMFSCFHGTALDVSQLITYLPAFVFPANEREVVDHMAFGVSLGGHAVWHCVLQDPRISTAVSVIGCADYTRLMRQRAGLSKLETWTSSQPPGSTFLGSKDFPTALQRAVAQYDPAGLFLGAGGEGIDPSREPTPQQLTRLTPLFQQRLQGKRIFLLAGGVDKLVPYACSEAFMGWLKRATSPSGWFSGRGTVVRDQIYEGVGHEMTPTMAKDGIEFVFESLQSQSQSQTRGQEFAGVKI